MDDYSPPFDPAMGYSGLMPSANAFGVPPIAQQGNVPLPPGGYVAKTASGQSVSVDANGHPIGNSDLQISPYAGMKMTRGLRNNNPGNIEDGPFAKGLPGYAGGDGRFAKFANIDHGQEAIHRLLGVYGQQGINTVSGIINKWAPLGDNNPTSDYAATVAKALGVSPDQKIDLKNPDILKQIGLAIGQFENKGGSGGGFGIPIIDNALAHRNDPIPLLDPLLHRNASGLSGNPAFPNGFGDGGQKSMQIMALLQMMAPKHSFIPVDYDPYKVAPKT